HRRDTLATLLWPNSDDKTARKNLRLSYYRLRQTIDQYGNNLSDRLFTSSNQSIQAVADPTIFWADTAVFQTLLTECGTHPHADLHTCTSCLSRLTEAVNLYQGELLSGFYLADAETFDEWLLVMRERLHRQALDALETLIMSNRQQRHYEKVREYAQRQLAMEPWREESYRSLMQAHAYLGQRSDALALYDACRQALLDELGVVPDIETEALYEQIRAETIGKSSVAVQQPQINH
ncbi:MAG: bacterial transcriptional activator domain-containing protein, partial [Anaerolineales bacterium]|nr:bacterial transcriptional activator domain-containing protein [Anaerolineales bacterium]